MLVECKTAWKLCQVICQIIYKQLHLSQMERPIIRKNESLFGSRRLASFHFLIQTN